VTSRWLVPRLAQSLHSRQERQRRGNRLRPRHFVSRVLRRGDAKIEECAQLDWQKSISSINEADGATGFQASRHYRLGSGPDRTCLDRVDEAPWIHEICSARRRLGVRLSRMRLPNWRVLNCWGSASTYLGPRPQKRCSPVIRCHPVSPPTRNTPTSSSNFRLPSDAPTHSLWGRARKHCPHWLTHLPASPPGCSTTVTATHSTRRRSPRPFLGRTINGHSAGDLTGDDVLDNIALY
jgi:hypothetical protein